MIKTITAIILSISLTAYADTTISKKSSYRDTNPHFSIIEGGTIETRISSRKERQTLNITQCSECPVSLYMSKSTTLEYNGKTINRDRAGQLQGSTADLTYDPSGTIVKINFYQNGN